MVLAIFAALLAAGTLLAFSASAGKARAAVGDTPSPSPSATVLQVKRNHTVVASYTLAQLEAMTPFAGYAGYFGGSVHGPDAVTGAKITDIVQDALGTPLTATQSVEVAEAPVATGYAKTFAGADLLDPSSGWPTSPFTLFDASNTANAITPTGTIAAVLVYTDVDQHVMPTASGPLRFFVADSNSDNGVMTGKYSVSQVNLLKVIDNVTVALKAKHTSVKLGKTIIFKGTVTNAAAGYSAVKLRMVKAGKYPVVRSGRITSAGGFKLTCKAAKAGKWHFVVTYRIGTSTFMSNVVKIKVYK
jgi:hypothetical protein